MEVDWNVEMLIWVEFVKVYLDDGILGEEYGMEEGVFGYIWVIDLIDGIVNFVIGIL